MAPGNGRRPASLADVQAPRVRGGVVQAERAGDPRADEAISRLNRAVMLRFWAAVRAVRLARLAVTWSLATRSQATLQLSPNAGRGRSPSLQDVRCVVKLWSRSPMWTIG